MCQPQLALAVCVVVAAYDLIRATVGPIQCLTVSGRCLLENIRAKVKLFESESMGDILSVQGMGGQESASSRRQQRAGGRASGEENVTNW